MAPDGANDVLEPNEDGDDQATEPDGFGVFRRYFDVLPQ